jgi:4-hydroxyphenylpyruvate dioxygenase-like putative hemolysin
MDRRYLPMPMMVLLLKLLVNRNHIIPSSNSNSNSNSNHHRRTSKTIFRTTTITLITNNTTQRFTSNSTTQCHRSIMAMGTRLRTMVTMAHRHTSEATTSTITTTKAYLRRIGPSNNTWCLVP